MADRKIIIQQFGRQRVVTVGEGGKHNFPSEVIWDESDHGPVPQNFLDNVGGLEGTAPNLTINNGKKTQQDNDIAQEESDKAAKAADRAQALADLKNFSATGNNNAQLSTALNKVLQVMGIK